MLKDFTPIVRVATHPLLLTVNPDKGSSAAMVDLLAGQIELNFESPPNVLKRAEAGQLRVLGITSDKRSPLLPQVPTLAEAGVPNAEMLQWFSVMAPAKMPAEIAQKLNTEIRAGRWSPGAQARTRARPSMPPCRIPPRSRTRRGDAA